ncbi:hypothetical protein BRADI_4g24580v3 [Brachypodium distachyon]|uniref:Serpin domain-containing protein n=1 Tax=Brachypodium distachyon TaxID=15368 RepID=A0A0Q3ISX8_BRADI|nr:hypothetical protein BRADI_4g24580v3 [Brachypodium distachyon]
METGSAAESATEGALAAFSAGLARRLADSDAYSTNLVFSPLSVYTALALMAAGARGATLDELLRVLGVSSRGELDEFLSRAAALMRDRSATGGPLVASACGVWSDLSCPLKPGFVEAVVSASGESRNTEAAAVNFRGDVDGACRRINAWAARATEGLIDGVLAPSSVAKETLVVLGSAVYFKSEWDTPFEKRLTADRLFRRLGGAGEVEVPFMRSWKRQYVAVHDGFKVLTLRYKMEDPYAPVFNLSPQKRLAPCSESPNGDERHESPRRFNRNDRHKSPVAPRWSWSWPFFPWLRRRPDRRLFDIRECDPLGGRAGPYSGGESDASSSDDDDTMTQLSSSDDEDDTMAQFSMCIFLPDADDGLPSLINSIASRPSFLHEHLPRQPVDVGEFRVPRFKLSFHDSLVVILRQLGFELPFSDVADFSDMAAECPLTLDEVVHKAALDVNEEGTEVAAVTLVDMRAGRSARPPPQQRVDFVADHPFAYFIMEEDSGTVIFAGHIVDPSTET